MKHRALIKCTVPGDPDGYHPDTRVEFDVGDDDGDMDKRAVEIAQERVAEKQKEEKFGKKFGLKEVQKIIFSSK